MPAENTVIFHIDVNSAYLSWTAIEKLKNGSPVDLRAIPSIIGGDEKSRQIRPRQKIWHPHRRACGLRSAEMSRSCHGAS